MIRESQNSVAILAWNLRERKSLKWRAKTTAFSILKFVIGNQCMYQDDNRRDVFLSNSNAKINLETSNKRV